MTKRPSVSIVIFVVLTAIASPDFLLNLVALANFMRLSLLKGAHAALSCAAWQEIRVPRISPPVQRLRMTASCPDPERKVLKPRINVS
jgi:hypothetical protein